MVELAKLLTERDDRLMIKFFIMKQPSDSKVSAYIEWLNSSSISNRIQFINLPSEDEPTTSFDFFSFIESKKPQLKDVLSKLTLVESSSNTSRVAAVVLDIFYTPMIDAANEFGIPTYIYYTSGANFLGLIFHIQTLHDEHNQDNVAYKDSNTELVVPVNVYYVMCFRPNYFTCTAYLYLYYTLLVPHTYASYIRHWCIFSHYEIQYNSFSIFNMVSEPLL